MGGQVIDFEKIKQQLSEDIAMLRSDASPTPEGGTIDKSGGGPQPPDMTDARLDRLETDVSTLHQDMRGVQAVLVQIQATLSTLPTKAEIALLPTKRDLTNNIFASLAIGLAIMGLVVGGIIGGLSWIKPDAAPPTPVTITAPPPTIVQIPASQPPAATPPSPAPGNNNP